MSGANPRYRTSAPRRRLSEQSRNANTTYDNVPKSPYGHSGDAFDLDSSGEFKNSAYSERGEAAVRHRRKGGQSRSLHQGSTSKPLHDGNDYVTKRVLSAQHIKINDLKNEIDSLSLELDKIRKENKILKRTVVIHEKSLGKYEDKDGDLPQLIERHSQETHALKEQLRKYKDQNGKLAKSLRDTQEELEATRKLLKKLQAVASGDELLERNELSRQLSNMANDINKKNARIEELERHIEILAKTHSRELNAEARKVKDLKLELGELQQKLDKLQHHHKDIHKESAVASSSRSGHGTKSSQQLSPLALEAPLSSTDEAVRAGPTLDKDSPSRSRLHALDENNGKIATGKLRQQQEQLQPLQEIKTNMSVAPPERSVFLNSMVAGGGTSARAPSPLAHSEQRSEYLQERVPASQLLTNQLPEFTMVPTNNAPTKQQQVYILERLPATQTLANEQQADVPNSLSAVLGVTKSDEALAVLALDELQKDGRLEELTSARKHGCDGAGQMVHVHTDSESIKYSQAAKHGIQNALNGSRSRPDQEEDWLREQTPINTQHSDKRGRKLERDLSWFKARSPTRSPEVSEAAYRGNEKASKEMASKAALRAHEEEEAKKLASEVAATDARRKKDLLLQKMKEIDRSRGSSGSDAILLGAISSSDSTQNKVVLKPSSAAMKAAAPVPALKSGDADDKREKLRRLLHIDADSVTAANDKTSSVRDPNLTIGSDMTDISVDKYLPSFVAKDKACAGSVGKKPNFLKNLFTDNELASTKEGSLSDDFFSNNFGGKQRASGNALVSDVNSMGSAEGGGNRSYGNHSGAPVTTGVNVGRTTQSMLSQRAKVELRTLPVRPAVKAGDSFDDDIEELVL